MEITETIDIQKKNERIARFIGAKFDRAAYGFPGQGSMYRRKGDFLNSLEYDCSLDALMPVIDKIVACRGGSLDGNIMNVEFHMKSSIHGHNVIIRVDTVHHTKTLEISKPLIDVSGAERIDTIYCAVNKFLDWYI